MKILAILIGSFLLLLSFDILLAEQELRPYRLVNADRLNVDRLENEYLTRLTGNVHFFYGDTEFFSDQAEIYEEQKLVRMFGNVQVFEDSLSLSADHVEYLRLDEEITLVGNVYIREEHQDGTIRTFQSVRGEYLRNEQQIYAWQDIFFYDERENLQGTCNYLDYNLESGYGFITNSPQIEVIGEQPLTITAEQIEFYRDFNRLAASFDVNTYYDEYLVKSDFLLYFTDDKYAVFLGEPRLEGEVADASAETFYLHFDEDSITHATLENDCRVYFATREGGEKQSRIDCDLMELIFNEGYISEMQAFDNVKSHYVSEPDNRDHFVNYTESDKLVVKFNNENQIESVDFYGQVRGQYKFSDKTIDNSEE